MQEQLQKSLLYRVRYPVLILQNPPTCPIDQAAILVDNLIKGVFILLDDNALEQSVLNLSHDLDLQ